MSYFFRVLGCYYLFSICYFQDGQVKSYILSAEFPVHSCPAVMVIIEISCGRFGI